MDISILTPDELAQIKKKRSIRRTLAKKSHFWFFSIYLGHYIGYPFAPFHHEMFAITEDTNLKLAVLVAFRGSGKSTFMSLSYPIWAVVGAQQKKFVLIVSQTQSQARLHLSNIKKELETNELLNKDIGPFEEVSDEWGATSIVLSNFDARIAIASTEQSIRGIRYGQYRPDLVICDDVEDLNSAKTKESRDKTFQWLNGEILPIGDETTKFVIVGNLLHEDCLLMRLKTSIESKKLGGKFYAYPLLTNDDEIAWPGKFSDMTAISELKESIGNDSAWFREYLLKIISDSERLVHPEWIHYYDNLPDDNDDFVYFAVGVDPAVSLRDSADCTAIVAAKVNGQGDGLRIYILPNPTNNRLTFPQTIDIVKNLSQTFGVDTKIFIEDVGCQKGLVQILNNCNIPCEGTLVGNRDKRSRLALTTFSIQQGKIFFPRHGAEDLITQLIGFGIEKHEDLADAFSLLILKIIELDNTPEPQMFICQL